MTENKKVDMILLKLEEMNGKIERMNARLDSVDARLDLVDARLDSVDARLDSVDAKFEVLDKKIDSLDTKYDRKLDVIEKDVKSIRITIENELRVNIMRVAEGHLDLSRNLHEVMKPSEEMEELSIRVRMLESDVRCMKNKAS